MTIYIDTDFKCHLDNDGTMATVETNAFDGKCVTYIEGYRFVPQGDIWTRADGKTFRGEMIAPWVDWHILDTAQCEYDALKAQADDMAAALELLGVSG